MNADNSSTGDRVEEGRRPIRRASAAANSNVYIESGTDDEDPGPKRKYKKAEDGKRAKRQRRVIVSSSDSSEESDPELNHILQLSQREDLIQVKREIQKKFMGEEGEEVKREDPDFDTEFHKPSDIARKTEKKNALAELEKKRKLKNEKAAKKAEQVYDVDEIFGGDKEIKSSGDDSSDSTSSDGEVIDDDDNVANKKKKKTPVEYIGSHHQLNSIRLSRYKISKFCHTPFFEDLVKGCFVRLCVGSKAGKSVYRAVQVIGVGEDPKTYLVEKVWTNKTLVLKHGRDERAFKMDIISSKDILPNEYFAWREAMEKARLPLPTKDFIQKKRDAITAAFNHQFTDEEVQKMVEQNQKFKNVPAKQATQKSELIKLKYDAEVRGDLEKAQEIQRQIDRIAHDLKQKELKDAAANKNIALINERNRQAQIKALKEKSMREREAGNQDEDDPFNSQFSRKAGRTRLVTGRAKNKF